MLGQTSTSFRHRSLCSVLHQHSTVRPIVRFAQYTHARCEPRSAQHTLLHNSRVARKRSFQVVRSSLSTTEEVTAQLKELEQERDIAVADAESAARTSVKLQEMVDLLEQLALRRVKEGDEDAAREVLKEKQSVSQLLEKTSERAQSNYALAAKLAQRIGNLQQDLVVLLAQSTGAATPPPPPPPSPPPPADPPSYNYRPVLAPWEIQLQEARERIAQAERDAAEAGFQGQLSAQESISAARERLRAQASESVSSALDRIRQNEVQRETLEQARERLRRNAVESIEEAQARLREEDERLLRHAREVVRRYANRAYARPGEYVTDSEMEGVFREMERRFGGY